MTVAVITITSVSVTAATVSAVVMGVNDSEDLEEGKENSEKDNDALFLHDSQYTGTAGNVGRLIYK